MKTKQNKTKQNLFKLIIPLLFFAFSCSKKEKSVVEPTQTTTARVMEFSSIAEYESLFDDPNQTEAKVSRLAKKYNTFQEGLRVGLVAEDSLYPEVLQQILNEDHIVLIENWYIKVNAATEKVYVLDKEFANEYQDLVNENLGNGHIQVFSTQEDVLENLYFQKTNPSARRFFIFCRERWAKDKKDEQKIDIGYLRFRHTICYRPLAILFQIHIEGSFNGIAPDGTLTQLYYEPNYTIVGFNAEWKKRCGDTYSHGIGHVGETDTYNLPDGQYGDFRTNIYSGVAALTKYKVRIKLNDFTANHPSRELEIIDGY